jgi:hypothetical protein
VAEGKEEWKRQWGELCRELNIDHEGQLRIRRMLLEPWTYEDGNGFEVTVIPETVDLKATVLRKMVRLALLSSSTMPSTPAGGPAGPTNQENSSRAFVFNSDERMAAMKRKSEDKAAEAAAKKQRAHDRQKQSTSRDLDKCREGLKKLKAKQVPKKDQMISLLLHHMKHVGANDESIREKRRALNGKVLAEVSEVFRSRNDELGGEWPVPEEDDFDEEDEDEEDELNELL